MAMLAITRGYIILYPRWCLGHLPPTTKLLKWHPEEVIEVKEDVKVIDTLPGYDGILWDDDSHDSDGDSERKRIGMKNYSMGNYNELFKGYYGESTIYLWGIIWGIN